MGRIRLVATFVSALLLGIVLGGYLFAQSQPRSVIALNRCDQCLKASDLAGLIASAGVQRLGGHLPFVVLETDRSIALRYPFLTKHHYVIVPKKDIKNLGQISASDAPYLLDALYVARHLIESEHLHFYSLESNGPGLQSVTYLHFHLIER